MAFWIYYELLLLLPFCGIDMVTQHLIEDFYRIVVVHSHILFFKRKRIYAGRMTQQGDIILYFLQKNISVSDVSHKNRSTFDMYKRSDPALKKVNFNWKEL